MSEVYIIHKDDSEPEIGDMGDVNAYAEKLYYANKYYIKELEDDGIFFKTYDDDFEEKLLAVFDESFEKVSPKIDLMDEDKSSKRVFGNSQLGYIYLNDGGDNEHIGRTLLKPTGFDKEKFGDTDGIFRITTSFTPDRSYENTGVVKIDMERGRIAWLSSMEDENCTDFDKPKVFKKLYIQDKQGFARQYDKERFEDMDTDVVYSPIDSKIINDMLSNAKGENGKDMLMER